LIEFKKIKLLFVKINISKIIVTVTSRNIIRNNTNFCFIILRKQLLRFIVKKFILLNSQTRIIREARALLLRYSHKTTRFPRSRRKKNLAARTENSAWGPASRPHENWNGWSQGGYRLACTTVYDGLLVALQPLVMRLS